MPDPIFVARPPFTTSGDTVERVRAYLRARLVQPVPVADRDGGGEYVGPTVAFGDYRFDADPTEAVEHGVNQRTDDTAGGLPFVLVGYSRTGTAQTSANRQPVVQTLPLAVVVCQPLRGAEYRDEDFEALDVCADFVVFWLSSRFLNPATLGLVGLTVGDADAGTVAGAPVNFRRITLTAYRSLLAADPAP